MFGTKLKELRLTEGLTQKQLSEMIDCNQSMITRWEKNECEPTATAIKKIAIIFQVTTDYLLELEEIDGRIVEEKTNKIDTPNISINTNNHKGDLNFKYK